MRNNKTYIISVCMVICFIVSYLPVTNSWYLSFKGHIDLSKLVISVISIKQDVEKKGSKKEINKSIDNIFRELKIATGQIKVKKDSDKEKIHLTEIIPEFPLLPQSLRLKAITAYQYKIQDKTNFYQSILTLIDPPPPKKSLNFFQKTRAVKIS